MPIVKKEEFEKYLTSFKQKNKTEDCPECKRFVTDLGNGETKTEYIFGDKAAFTVIKRHVNEAVGVEINGLSFTFEVPLIRNEFYSTDQQQHRCYYEKVR